MGNKNNKLKYVPKLNSTPAFDKLPVEIIYKILDQLDIITIFSSLFHVCKRFDKIILKYDQYDFDLQDISIKNFRLISSNISRKRIIKLTLLNDENNTKILELFLRKFSINQFSRLRSLTLIKIDNEEYLNQILITIADRTCLENFSSITIINREEAYGDVLLEILMTVLNRSSIRKVHLRLSDDRTTSNPLLWLEQCSIKELTLDNTCTMNFFRNTLLSLPELETFKMRDLRFDQEIDLNHQDNELENIDDESDIENNENYIERKEKFASIQSSNNLKSLTINCCSINMSKIEWLLQEIPTLKKLRLGTEDFYKDQLILDGNRWENILSNIDQFQCLFLVDAFDDSKFNIDISIRKFQTPFWIEEKQWFITIEKHRHNIILYTLPHVTVSYGDIIQSIPLEYRSTANQILQNSSMNNVRLLFLDASHMIKTQLNNLIIPRFPQIETLCLDGKWSKSKTFFDDIKTILDLTTVDTLIRLVCLPTIDFMTLLDFMPNLKSIKTSTNLLNALNAAKFSYQKCLHSLTIDTNSLENRQYVNIEPFCTMFPRIENLIIPIENVDSCQYIIEQLKQDLIYVIFRITSDYEFVFESDSDNENEDYNENITAHMYTKWIKKLPKQYYCDKKQKEIHIWLK